MNTQLQRIEMAIAYARLRDGYRKENSDTQDAEYMEHLMGEGASAAEIVMENIREAHEITLDHPFLYVNESPESIWGVF
jgi:hypothetical protein